MLHSVDKANYRLQKVYFVVLPSKLSLSISHILALRYIARSHIRLESSGQGRSLTEILLCFLAWNRKSDKVFCFCLLVLGIFHLFTRPSCSFSSQKALEDMERVKNNRITEFHYFLAVGGGITLSKKD